ncbi:MAG: hypothetical protein HY721_11455, partial [Planctomycetes bacterium]|nr:hypothetical protein [Planctomycetota bacterium]
HRVPLLEAEAALAGGDRALPAALVKDLRMALDRAREAKDAEAVERIEALLALAPAESAPQNLLQRLFGFLGGSDRDGDEGEGDAEEDAEEVEDAGGVEDRARGEPAAGRR